VTASNILHLSSDELERAVEHEQIENPALDVTEQRVCLFCGAHIYGQACTNCGNFSQSTQAGSVRESSPSYDSRAEPATFYDIDNSGFTEIDSDDAYDPMAHIPTGETLTEALLQQLEALVTPDDAPIAEQLVGNLNDHGYLEMSVNEIAAHLQVAVERVEYVLGQLQTLEPLGIGARNLRECLLIQLQALAEQETPHPLAYTLLDRYLDMLGKNQLHEIARELKVSEQELRQASVYIRSTLHPFPAHMYWADIHYTPTPTGATYVRPDVIIRKGDIDFEVELIEAKRYHFQVKTAYPDVSQQTTQIPGKASEDIRRYMHEHSDRAQFFVDSVQRRWRTLQRVAELVINYQREFLEKGVRYLRPLTRSEVATRLNLDEGTVSRTIANKYALLPNGRLMPMSDFFDGSLSIKDVLRELIRSEEPKRRLSDEDLARLLTARGIPMARRTVTKYREEMGIGSSRER
jgi:RNA polymerase sigma-54 factor